MDKITINKRRSGVLLHISSLPSPYGIGTLGKDAYAFVDFLKSAGFGIWQVLPIGPTSYGDSPYQSFSMFAGNPYFIDLDMLVQDGMLDHNDFIELVHNADGMYVDYEYLYKTRWTILRTAYKNAYSKVADNVDAFAKMNKWLPDYALFCALKDKFEGQAWLQWPDNAIRLRQRNAVFKYKALLEDDIQFYMFVQYLFFKQWFALKAYANKNGIIIFGDMPIYVAMDSADAWTVPKAFLLDTDRRPTCVAGVPPDYFSEDGQLWGNPLYDWGWHKRNRYKWWKNRMRAMQTLYDLVRIDHFIGFANYYAVPANAQTARHGTWRDAPGHSLFRALSRALPDMHIVAEDLGVVTPKVKKLLEKCGFPGMKVLTFAFDSDESNQYLPHNFSANNVLYTGTHDNDTTLGWWNKAQQEVREFTAAYTGLRHDQSICSAMIETAYKSPAETVIIPIQDFLELGSEARMNIPGTVGDNWKWRLVPGQIDLSLAEKLLELNRKYNRIEA